MMFVADYNIEPTCVNVDLTTFKFEKTPATSPDTSVYELKAGEYILLETVDTTAICLVKLNGGLKVVTGTISSTDNVLTYDNTTASLAKTYGAV